ncbi:fimbrial protein [Paraburkholderia sp. B3]|uniref:fimbrial protein n=1 Tax=Paraburkholderia sp. B3 TaxID=3134791 RepID=UPI003981DFBF
MDLVILKMMTIQESLKMKKIAISTIVAAMGLAAAGAHAGPANNGGVLTINGALTAQTCTVNGNGSGSNNFTVTLPTESAAALSAAGSVVGATGFSIALTNCAQSGKVRTFFEYGSNTLADGNLLNNGSATNVEVQLLDYNNGSNVIDVSKADGAQNSNLVTISSGAANLQYAAQYISPTGGATQGAVTTNVTYSMSYQ